MDIFINSNHTSRFYRRFKNSIRKLADKKLIALRDLITTEKYLKTIHLAARTVKYSFKARFC